MVILGIGYKTVHTPYECLVPCGLGWPAIDTEYTPKSHEPRIRHRIDLDIFAEFLTNSWLL